MKDFAPKIASKWRDHVFAEDWARLGSMLRFDPCQPPLLISAVNEGGVEANLEHGFIVLGERYAFEADRAAVLHEIGHLMVTRDERVGARAWGMQDRSIVNVGGGLMKEPMTVASIRHEAAAWAWQSLLCDMLELPDDERGKKVWSSAYLMPSAYLLGKTKEDINDATGVMVNTKRDEILQKYGDLEGVQQAVANRIASLPRLLEERRVFENDMDNHGSSVVEEARAMSKSSDIELVHTSWTGGSGQPVHTVEAEIRVDHKLVDSTMLECTRSIKRADRVLSWNSELHDLAIRRLHDSPRSIGFLSP